VLDTLRAAIIDDQQERLLGSDGLLHPAEFTVTELTLVETTDSDPSKWQVLFQKKSRELFRRKLAHCYLSNLTGTSTEATDFES
jgi:hypothetical protein